MLLRPDKLQRRMLKRIGVRWRWLLRLDDKQLAFHLACARRQHSEHEDERHILARAIARTAYQSRWLFILLFFICVPLYAQRPGLDGLVIQSSGGGVVHGTYGGVAKLKCTGSLTCSYASGVTTLSVSSAVIAGRPYVDVVADCGAVGDGATDDGATINTCLTSNAGKTVFFPKTQASGVADYYSTVQLVPQGYGQVLLGAGSSWPNVNNSLGNSTIKFASNVTGIFMDQSNCRSCIVRGLGLLGGDTTLDLQSPTTFIIPQASDFPQFNRSISSIQRASNVLTVSVSANAGGEKLTQSVGAVVAITGVVGDATMNGTCVVSALSGLSSLGGNPGTFTCSQIGSDSGPYATDGTLKLATLGTKNADGIRICGNFITLDNVSVYGFARYGINADSTAGHGCTTAFSDDLIVTNSFITNNQVGGYFGTGVDSNASYFSANSIYYNGLYAVEEGSSLGNTWIANQMSYNGYPNGTASTPASKSITSISRTSGVTSVVLASADANIKVGSAVVIAGVTDSSFNTTSGSAFFVSAVADTTHYTYTQPGNPANASSSGGTSHIAKYQEATVASGIENGSAKVGFGSGLSQTVWINNYIEGGQPCKFNVTTLIFGGASTPSCATIADDFMGANFSTEWLSGGTLSSNLGFLGNKRDGSYELSFVAGKTTDQDLLMSWNNHSGSRTWRLDVLNTGTLGANGYWHLTSDGTNQTRIVLFGSNNTGHSDISAAGAGAVRFNKNFSGTNAGTGGVEFYSGGSSPSKVASVSSTGLVTPGSTTVASLPSAASSPGAMIRVSDSTTVSAEGQTCVGSSSNNALAFSNGSVWKCF